MRFTKRLDVMGLGYREPSAINATMATESGTQKFSSALMRFASSVSRTIREIVVLTRAGGGDHIVSCGVGSSKSRMWPPSRLTRPGRQPTRIAPTNTGRSERGQLGSFGLRAASMLLQVGPPRAE